jgi:radical SAM superfamily enzyme YgiQ (UPF0313 family)
MRVLFIQPPGNRFDEFKYWGVASHQQFIPLAILYLSAALKQSHNNFITEFLDLNLHLTKKNDYNNIRDFINFAISKNNLDQPDIISITCNFNPCAESYELITSRVKEVWPHSKTIVGGFLPTGVPELFLKDTNTDFVCIGEGELALNKFVTSLNKGNLENIYGVYTRDNLKIAIENNNIIRTESVESLDDLPLPDYSIIEKNIDQYDVIPILFSRGCPNRCTFCANNLISGKKIRYRSVDSIIKEIDSIYTKYHKKTYHVCDANPTVNKKLFLSIIDSVKKNWGSEIQFNLFNGVDINYCDNEIIKAIKSCGNSTIMFAAESGSSYVLSKLMLKKMDLDKAKYLSAKAREIGLNTGCYFILGMPGETDKMRNETFEYARSFPTDWCTFSIAAPLPGSKLYSDCIKNGIITIKTLDDLAKMQTHNRSFNLPDLSAEEIMRIQERFDKIINYIENYNYKVGNFERAILRFKTVSQHHPFQILAHLMLLKIYREQGTTNSDKLRASLEKEEEIVELLRNNSVSRNIYNNYKFDPLFRELCNLITENVDQ